MPGAAPTAQTSATTLMATASLIHAARPTVSARLTCPAAVCNWPRSATLTPDNPCRAGTVYTATNGTKQVCCASGTTPYTDRWGVPKCCAAGGLAVCMRMQLPHIPLSSPSIGDYCNLFPLLSFIAGLWNANQCCSSSNGKLMCYSAYAPGRQA